ncbi:baseplate J/gp47 family protein [Streptomyces sp. NPDC006465]|uniref:baseplate J/gp47 family protein n=1 Tax=Streptomyces sp. NPDC006465 TaxID=3157174 RepID=UPI0033A4B2A2
MAEDDQATDLENLARVSGSDKAFGITPQGFVPKPLARLLDEKKAAAQVLFGSDVDLTAGSTLRKILEIIALEEARTWVHLGLSYEDTRVSTAVGDALSRLGAELGLPRPHHRATGKVTLKLAAALPPDVPEVEIERGTRLLTTGGQDYFLDESATLTNSGQQATVAVKAVAPGPEFNADPHHVDQDGTTPGRISRFNPADPRTVHRLARTGGVEAVTIEHTTATGGGELYWSDSRYRDLLLAHPRNVWSPETMRITAALVPGVRQVLVKDLFGGLDINQPIFGSFSFLERLFSQERSLGDPTFFTVLVAPDEGAIWEGTGQLRDQVAAALDQVRPVGIAPKIEQAQQVSVGLNCKISVDGLPIPVGLPEAVKVSPEAIALKSRILDRVRRRVLTLGIGEPVRYSEVLWAVMEEPGVVDARDLRLRRFPRRLPSVPLDGPEVPQEAQELEPLQDVEISPTEIALLVDSLEDIIIV